MHDPEPQVIDGTRTLPEIVPWGESIEGAAPPHHCDPH